MLSLLVMSNVNVGLVAHSMCQSARINTGMRAMTWRGEVKCDISWQMRCSCDMTIVVCVTCGSNDKLYKMVVSLFAEPVMLFRWLVCWLVGWFVGWLAC